MQINSSGYSDRYCYTNSQKSRYPKRVNNIVLTESTECSIKLSNMADIIYHGQLHAG